MSPKHRQLRQDFLARPVWSLLKDPDLDAPQLLDETEHAINTELYGTLRQKVIQRRRKIATSMVAVVALIGVNTTGKQR